MGLLWLFFWNYTLPILLSLQLFSHKFEVPENFQTLPMEGFIVLYHTSSPQNFSLTPTSL